MLTQANGPSLDMSASRPPVERKLVICRAGRGHWQAKRMRSAWRRSIPSPNGDDRGYESGDNSPVPIFCADGLRRFLFCQLYKELECRFHSGFSLNVLAVNLMRIFIFSQALLNALDM